MTRTMNQKKIACQHKMHKHAIQSNSMADLEGKFNNMKAKKEAYKNKIYIYLEINTESQRLCKKLKTHNNESV